MSLRNAWTRYVPVGNRLSGIYCPIIVKPDDQIGDFKRVRNPGGARMRMHETQRKLSSGKYDGRVALASTKQWRESEYYKKKQHKFRKQLTELWHVSRPAAPPHTPSPPRTPRCDFLRERRRRARPPYRSANFLRGRRQQSPAPLYRSKQPAARTRGAAHRVARWDR